MKDMVEGQEQRLLELMTCRVDATQAVQLELLMQERHEESQAEQVATLF